MVSRSKDFVAASKRAVAFRLEDPGPQFDQLVQIGQGSSGLVFSAVCNTTSRSVAIKKLDMGKQVQPPPVLVSRRQAQRPTRIGQSGSWRELSQRCSRSQLAR